MTSLRWPFAGFDARGFDSRLDVALTVVSDEIAAGRAQLSDYATRLSQSQVLITGGRGFLGGHAAAALRRAGARVVCVTRQPDALTSEGWVACDYSDPAAVARVVRQVDPDVILHFAGFASSRPGLVGVRAAFEANVLASYHLLLGVADECPRARVVTAGTLEASDPMREIASFASPYGASKAMSELLNAMLRDFADVDVRSLRIGMTYGPGEPNEQRLVPFVIGSLLSGRSPTVSRGDRLEDWVYVDDVVAAVLATATATARAPSAYDVGTGRRIPMRHVVDTLHTLIEPDRPRTRIELPDRPGDQHQATVERTRQALGWSPKVGLEAGLRETLRLWTGPIDHEASGNQQSGLDARSRRQPQPT